MKRRNKHYFIIISMALSLVACGEGNAQNETASNGSSTPSESGNAVMVEKKFKYFNSDTRKSEIIEYKACMEGVNSKDAKLIMNWSNKPEEEKEGGWRDFKSAKLMDECPKPRTAHCAGGPDTGESDFYYTDSKKILTILREECTASYEDMTEEDKEIAARVGGKWTSFTGDEAETSTNTIPPEPNTDKATNEPLSDSERAARNVQNAENALGAAFYGHKMKDKASILELLKEEPGAIRVLESKFRNDKDIVLAATSQNGRAFQYASENLKKDRAFVITVVKQNADALEFADSSMKKDKEVVLAALRSKNGKAINHIDDSLKKDKEVILALLKDDYEFEIFRAAPKEYKKDPEFMKAAIKNNADLLELAYDDHSYIDPELMKDKEFALYLVSQKGTLLCRLDNKLKKDKEIAIVAIGNNAQAMFCINESLQEDKDIQDALEAFKERIK